MTAGRGPTGIKLEPLAISQPIASVGPMPGDARSFLTLPVLPLVISACTFVPLPFVPVLTLGPLLALIACSRQLWKTATVRPLGIFVGAAYLSWAAMALISFLSERRLGIFPTTLNIFSLTVIWLPWVVVTLVWAAGRVGPRLGLLAAVLGGGFTSLLFLDDRGSNFKYFYGLWLVLALLVTAWRSWRWGVVAVIISIASASSGQVRHLVVILILALILNLCFRGKALRASTLVLGSVLAILTALAVLKMALAGWFGSAVQEITRSQAPDGSLATLLMSARPEGRANLCLLMADPLGGHLGEQLTTEQMWLVVRAFVLVNRDPSASYIQDYILSPTRPEFHSVLADFWFYGGVPGMALALGLLAIYVRGITWGLVERSFLGVVAIFMCARGVWDLAFSPLSDTRFDVVFIASTICLAWPHIVKVHGRNSDYVAVSRDRAIESEQMVPRRDAVSPRGGGQFSMKRGS